MTAAEVLAAERRIDAKVESVQRELFYAARSFRRLCERVDRLATALPPPQPAAGLKSPEVEKLKSRDLSTSQPFNPSTPKGGEA